MSSTPAWTCLEHPDSCSRPSSPTPVPQPPSPTKTELKNNIMVHNGTLNANFKTQILGELCAILNPVV